VSGDGTNLELGREDYPLRDLGEHVYARRVASTHSRTSGCGVLQLTGDRVHGRLHGAEHIRAHTLTRSHAHTLTRSHAHTLTRSQVDTFVRSHKFELLSF
jgi:hypothetical protein